MSSFSNLAIKTHFNPAATVDLDTKARISGLLGSLHEALAELAEKKSLPAERLTDFIDKAQSMGIVNREGMSLSGYEFTRLEDVGRVKPDAKMPAEIAKPALDHIQRHAQRAMNCINNPNGYTAPKTTLYGTRVLAFSTFNPIIP